MVEINTKDNEKVEREREKGEGKEKRREIKGSKMRS